MLFIDFQIAFPSVDRNLLFKTLKENGFTSHFIKMLENIYRETEIFIKNGQNYLAESYKTQIGLPEGCGLSPILFALFIKDLDKYADGVGINIGDEAGNIKRFWYLAFADDLGILGEDKTAMKEAVKQMEEFCNERKLKVNTEKTKVMIFGKGRPPKKEKFTMYGAEIEEVKSFKYLGIKFTVGMSFTEHLVDNCRKALSRMGYLFSKLDLRKFPIELAMKVFRTYIEPILTYGLAIFWGNVSQNAIQRLNAVQSKFLKRWIGIPTASNNAFLYHYTNTCPLNVWYDEVMFDKLWWKVQLPHLRNFIINKPDFKGQSEPNLWKIPTYMWFGKTSFQPPKNPLYRSRIGNEVFGWNHKI